MNKPLLMRVKDRFSRVVSRRRRDGVLRSVLNDRPVMESLEQRVMLSSTLLDIDPEYPRISYNSGTTLNYDATSQMFSVTATPFAYRASAVSAPRVVHAPRGMSLNIQIDNAGQLVGGVAGHDLIVEGAVDVDGNGVADYSGVLLTGEIIAFGALDSGPTDQYDFIFEATGGALVDAGIFAGKHIGVLMNSLNSSFADDFTVNFGGTTEGVIGPIDKPVVFHPGIDIEKYVKPVAEPSMGDDSCQTLGKPTQLTFRYTGDGPDATDTAQPEGKYTVTGDPNDASPVRIVVTSQSSLSGVSASNTFFDGTVDIDETFIAAVANAVGQTKFGANTYIYILDGAGNLLQRVQYHTSCSAPIVLGDQIGALRLEGFSSAAGTVVLPPQDDSDPGEDADDPTGPVVQVDSMVMFTYVVTNTGDVELADVVVIDDNATPGDAGDDFQPMPVLQGGFNVGDLDQDGRLDLDERWLYTSMTAVAEGQHVNIATVTGTPVDHNGHRVADDVTDSDPAHWYGESSGETDGLQGLTPGFWKQKHHFKFWTGFNPKDRYEAVFGVDVPGGNPTLLEALKSRGGGINALLRHSVAALLNAAHPGINYAYNVNQVIALVQSAFTTSSFESTKDEFEEENEREGVNLKTKDSKPHDGKSDGKSDKGKGKGKCK